MSFRKVSEGLPRVPEGFQGGFRNVSDEYQGVIRLFNDFQSDSGRVSGGFREFQEDF